ncbi:MAG TPA: hypothetical protein VNY36_09920 [Bacteroidia bacterium]|jgi:hypothetical protein|nr:hypothetical protein [Bacteroidia bacterium]
MNFKLILTLSLFGLFIAFATVYFIPFNIENILWPIIFVICAYLIAKNAPGKYFLHGFLTSLVNCIWITGAHVLLFSKYIATHMQELEMGNKMPILQGHPREKMLIIGPMFGIGFGIVLGLFSFIAGKLVKKA